MLGLGVKSCIKVTCLYKRNSLLELLETLKENGERKSVGFVKNLFPEVAVPVEFFLKTSN